MKNVLVLGAGKIGRMVASLLQCSGDYQVRVMDSHENSIAETLALAPGAQGMHGRFDDTAAVDKALAGQWAVVSCAPFFCNPMIAEHAKAAGVHYLDLTEDVAVTKKVMELAKGAKTAFIPQCGLAPGFITIAANHVIQGMGAMHEVKMRVGALPEFPSNALKYNLTWSTDGLINEYIQPCEAVVDGQVTVVPALEGLEHMMIDGIEFEAFNTSGGLGTFASTLEGKVKHLSYKTMRYPGHNAILKLLLWDLGFREHREELKAAFERALPTTAQDIVAIFVSATGDIGGRHTERTYAKIVRHKEIGGHHWTAIQITTACGITAVLDLLREGKLPSHGFVRNEDVAFSDFIANRFGKHYA
ncbi:MAG: saccharopine dehydrogenase [Planctomycetaceae bacterium]|nr:MAG: saccharopine dehydrogenase [Planctomycetaceae bacterium]